MSRVVKVRHGDRLEVSVAFEMDIEIPVEMGDIPAYLSVDMDLDEMAAEYKRNLIESFADGAAAYDGAVTHSNASVHITLADRVDQSDEEPSLAACLYAAFEALLKR